MSNAFSNWTGGDTITLDQANKLAKRVGDWIWDGLLYDRDSIINPELCVLPNLAGSRIRNIMAEIERGQADPL
jgi:hypothetical protein